MVFYESNFLYIFLGERQTKYILIVSTWRSGSTFFGELLTQYPGTYFSYEPLQYLSKRVTNDHQCSIQIKAIETGIILLVDQVATAILNKCL